MPSRRALLSLIALLAGPSHAQRSPRTIGLLLPWKDLDARADHERLTQEMLALGYGKSRLNIVLRTTDSVNSRLPARAEELVNLNVDLIVVASTNAVVAVRRASSSIPIVFFDVADPVASGLAESLARPGRNNTGLTNFSAGELSTKRIALAKQVLPDLARAALLINPVSATGDYEKATREVWEKFGFRRIVVRASSLPELEAAFKEIAAFHAQLVFVQIDAFFGDVASQIAELLLRYRLPSVFDDYDSARAGGLIIYGADGADNLRKVTFYVDKILSGQRAGDLPIQQPTKIKFALNRRTANALGLKIPQALLLQADEILD